MSGQVSRWFTPVVPPVFGRSVPAGRSSRVPAAPGGPDPSPPTAAVVLGARPRWVGCPTDGRLHLVGPAGVRVLETLGVAHAVCGRRVWVAGLMLRGPSAVVSELSSGGECVVSVDAVAEVPVRWALGELARAPLSAEQRQRVAALLDEIALGVRVVARVQARHPDDPGTLRAVQAECWTAVAQEYARLLAEWPAS